MLVGSVSSGYGSESKGLDPHLCNLDKGHQAKKYSQIVKFLQYSC